MLRWVKLCFQLFFWNHLTVRGSQEVIKNRDTTQTAISNSLTHCLISKLSGLAISWRNERIVGKIDYGLMHNLLTTKHASIWSQVSLSSEMFVNTITIIMTLVTWRNCLKDVNALASTAVAKSIIRTNVVIVFHHLQTSLCGCYRNHTRNLQSHNFTGDE